MNIKLGLIQPSTQPVRTSWDEEKMAELIESIKERGVIAPIKVRPINGRYEIVYGHRRFEASRRLGLEEIPAIVEEMDESDALVEQIIENEQREDLPILERAQSWERAMSNKAWSQRELFRRTGIPQATIAMATTWLIAKRQGASVISTNHNGEPADVVWSTVEIARSLGDDVEAKQKVAAKVGQEKIDQNDARRVADAYRDAEDEHERQAIIDTPFRDPDFKNLVKAKTRVKRETAKQQERKRQEEAREVAIYQDALRVFCGAALEAIEVAKYGKFSPEAGRFLKVQHDRLRGYLETLEHIWEARNA
jgi:ParB/RepB/Spo0J family partition protein